MTMVWDMQETITRWYMKSDASSPYLVISALMEVITILFIHRNQALNYCCGCIKGNHYIRKQGKKSSLVKGLKIELWALSCRE